MLDRDIKTANLKNINSYLSELLEGQDLNFCKLLIHDHKEDLSITAEYDPPENFVSLSSDKAATSNDFYYGVSPCLDKDELIRLISNFEVKTADGLNEYIDKHGDWFMMHSNQADYLSALARYIVICMASHFGIKIKMEPSIYDEFRDYLKDRGYSDAGIKTMLSYTEGWNKVKTKREQELRPKDSFLTIKGCPTNEVLRFLERYKYIYLCDEDAIPLIDTKTGKKKGSIDAWAIADNESTSAERKTINEAYSEHTELIEGKVFYSGVLLKPNKLELVRGSQENYKIQSLCIHFERSTYGTVCALDRNLTEHPVLKDMKRQIIKMLREDDDAKRNLSKRISLIDADDAEASVQMLDVVNDYLDKCLNVNQIGVSANVVTGDGLLLLGQRSQSNIDAKKLYPGANGNAEVADRNVSFYGLSVYADYPTIRTDSDRIDFFGEISRETYGELKINLTKQEWKCCGVVITGNIPEDDTEEVCYRESFRRMHFNLIFEHDTDKTFLEIEKLAPKAAEAFETERYLGVSVRCEKNRITQFLKTAARGIISIVSHKDFIEASVAVIMFLLAISRTFLQQGQYTAIDYLNFAELNWADALTLFLALLIIVITGLRAFNTLRRNYHRRKKTRFITVYQKTTYEEVNKLVRSALRLHRYKKEPLYSFHPAAAACLRYYVDRVMCDTFFPKDNR